jgi:two-component system, NtrC family, sensor kinase
MPQTLPGLRVQLLAALTGLLLLAFVPLYGAVTGLAGASLHAARKDAARSLGRAIAAHVAEVRTHAHQTPGALGRALQSHIGSGGAVAIGVYGLAGNAEATAGAPDALAELPPAIMPYGEALEVRASQNGPVLDVTVPGTEFAVKVRLLTTDESARIAPLSRLTALYIGIFGALLLLFTYVALTRLVVKPIESVARAADRVASGTRVFVVREALRARELYALRGSIDTMMSKLLANEETLEHKVAELTLTTQRLRDTRAELAGSERLASVGRLAAGIAHEIGNPITAIMGLQDLILEGDLPEDVSRDFTQRMRKETERMHSIVRDLLDFARADAPPSSQAGQEPPADVRAVATDVLALVQPQKDFREIHITSSFYHGDARVTLDPKRLTQVLLNLVVNAKDAMLSQAHPRTLHVQTSCTEGRMLIEVEDNGPGIAESDAAAIFAPFYTTKDVKMGTGLGLSVCKGIIESAGGTIVIRARYDGGSGARFVVDLPLAAAT